MKKILLAALLSIASLYGADHIIDQKGKTFIPHEVTVKVGDTLTFLNSDPFAHNAYTDDVPGGCIPISNSFASSSV